MPPPFLIISESALRLFQFKVLFVKRTHESKYYQVNR